MGRNKKKTLPERWNRETMFGPNLDFSAAEAYRLLRTNVMYSFASESRCHVIGISSAVSGEGKSKTSCNLSYALAEAGKKVLLLDGDLRLPTIAAKLGLRRSPGLTNLLVSNEDHHSAIQHCADIPGMDVIVAGESAPNPSELLGSGVMAELIRTLSEEYEYIIIDLPPITVVSDALVLSQLLHGVIMVVRKDQASERLLAEAMRQIQMVGLRVLGFVFNGTHSQTDKHYKRYRDSYYAKHSG